MGPVAPPRSFGDSSWCRCGTGRVALHSERSMGTGPLTGWAWKCLRSRSNRPKWEFQMMFTLKESASASPTVKVHSHSFTRFFWFSSLTSISSTLMQKMLLSSFNITWDVQRKIYENMLIFDGLEWVDIVWQMYLCLYGPGWCRMISPFPSFPCWTMQGLAAGNACDGLGKWLLCTFAICSLEGISSSWSRILGRVIINF